MVGLAVEVGWAILGRRGADKARGLKKRWSCLWDGRPSFWDTYSARLSTEMGRVVPRYMISESCHIQYCLALANPQLVDTLMTEGTEWFEDAPHKEWLLGMWLRAKDCAPALTSRSRVGAFGGQFQKRLDWLKSECTCHSGLGGEGGLGSPPASQTASACKIMARRRYFDEKLKEFNSLAGHCCLLSTYTA